MSNREDLVLLARVAEQTERYEGSIHRIFIHMYIYIYIYTVEMVEYTIEFAKLEPKLNIEERNLLSVAFKNVVRIRRAALVTLTSIERTEEQKSNNILGSICIYII